VPFLFILIEIVMSSRKNILPAIQFSGRSITILDQTKLPDKIQYIRAKYYQDVINAIKQLAVRGAPLIGVTGAYGLALASTTRALNPKAHLRKVALEIRKARPTAVNLSWAIDRMLKIINNPDINDKDLRDILINEAMKIDKEEQENSYKIGRAGAQLIKDNMTIMTICNTGWLAAPGIGTALGVIYTACKQHKNIKVYVLETRPLLQGSRLTAFELTQSKIPYTLITDNMMASVMSRVNIVLVGADRIVRNGDTANKIGTLTLAITAKYFGVPFYVVAPSSSFDTTKPTGKDIVIEERNPAEVRYIKNRLITLQHAHVYNPAFDITPQRLITGIITEQGILKPPFIKSIKKMIGNG
jgi:methylthioribose-1-phosphate isomerase